MLARRATHAPPALPIAEKAIARARTILVVDDDRLVHAIVGRIMAGFDGVLLYANDGKKALAMTRVVRPDLVLTDALLPGMDGRELSRTIKTDPLTSHTTVMVMTALYKGARYKQEAFSKFLVDAYVDKPLNLQTLRPAIELALAAPSGGGDVKRVRSVAAQVAL